MIYETAEQSLHLLLCQRRETGNVQFLCINRTALFLFSYNEGNPSSFGSSDCLPTGSSSSVLYPSVGLLIYSLGICERKKKHNAIRLNEILSHGLLLLPETLCSAETQQTGNKDPRLSSSRVSHTGEMHLIF